MREDEQEVARHYAREGLEAAILANLRASGKDLDKITTHDLAQIDHFHLGWHRLTEVVTEFLPACSRECASLMSDRASGGRRGTWRKSSGAAWSAST